MAIFLARYFADGDLDLTFGGNGVVRTQIDNYLDVRSISIGQQGQITVLVGGNSMLHHITCSASGTVETQGSSPFFPDPGSPVHPSSQVFAATMWSPPIPEVDPAVAEEILSPVLDRTRLMAAGWVITNRITEVAVASYLVSGAPDTHFGNSGQPNGQFTDRPLLANAAQAWGLHEGSDGRVLVAGFADSSEDSQYNFLVLRLLPNGFLDQSFNQEGRALTRFPGASSVARTVTTNKNLDYWTPRRVLWHN
jgi:uncharacterized delta-60 repeat protein